MRHTVVFTLRGALAAAVAVEWTDQSAPLDSAEGWQACVRLPEGGWRLANHEIGSEAGGHWRAPGLFAGLALRYRLSPSGPWSPISEDRKDILLAAVEESGAAPAALADGDWSAPEWVELGGEDRFTGAVVLSGAAAAAVAVEWTAGDDGVWRACLALGEGRWRLSGYGTDTAHVLAEDDDLTAIALRYRLVAGGRWSVPSPDRRTLLAGGLVAPVLLLAPVLTGTGKIGAAVAATSGTWGGAPAPEIAFQWLKDGVEIPGATAAVYTPGPEDDLAALSCRVAAVSRAGAFATQTAALAVTHVAPEAQGAIPEEVFDEGAGVQTVAAAGYFAGQALRFSVTGAGAEIDPATGVIGVSTAAPLSGEAITVTATNSGGSASQVFLVTVEGAETPVDAPAALTDTDWEITTRRDGEALRVAFRITNASHPAHPSQTGAGHVAFTAQMDAKTRDPVTTANKCERMTGWADSGNVNYGCWAATQNQNGVPQTWGDRTPEIGFDISATIWYTLDTIATAYVDAEWSAPSTTRKTITITDPDAAVGLPVVVASDAKRIMFKDLGEVDDLRSGDGGQICLAYVNCETQPNYLLAIQDTGHIHLSDNFGRSWFKTLCLGLTSRLGGAAWMHPTDPLRMAVYCRSEPDYPDSNEGGLFTTTDGGTNWTRRASSGTDSRRSSSNNCIGHSPANPSRMWFLPDYDNGQAPLWYSGNGGASWTNIKTFASTQIGRVSHIFGEPTNADVVWITSSTGLWRLTSASTTGATLEQISGTKGLPNGSISSRPYLSADGATMIVSRSGIWKRTTAGGNFTRVGSYAPNRLWINPYNPDQMLETNKAPFPRYSSNGGVTFQDNISVENRAGRTESSLSDEGADGVYWRQPGGGDNRLVYLFGTQSSRNQNCLCWVSNDGRNWTISMENYGGLQLSPQSSNKQMHLASNPLIYAGGYVDFGCRVSRDGLQSFADNSMRVRVLSTIKINNACMAIHPDFEGARPWLIASVGNTQNTGLPCISKNGGASWERAAGPSSQQSGLFMGYDQSDPQFAYWATYRSTTHGDSWTAMGALPANCMVMAMTETAPGLSNGQAIFALNRRGNGDGKIYRSIDRGVSWQLVVDMGNSGNYPAIVAQVDNHNVLFIRDPSNSSRIRKYNLASGTPTNRPFTLINCISPTTPGPFVVLQMSVDPHHPEHIAVLNGAAAGSPAMAIETTDGGATWTNLTGPMISAMPHRFIEILRTGDLVISGANGAFGKKRPTGFRYPNSSLYDAWALPTYVRPVHPLLA